MNAASLGTPTLETIHQGLLRDYYAQLGEKNYEQQTLDPVLGTILRLFAARMETLYSDQQNVRLALLDELIRGLSVEPRHAIPAQSVMRFALSPGHAAVVMPEGSDVSYDGPDGERLPFAADRSFQISAARIAMAFVYQNHFLRPCCVGQWAGSANPLYPKLDSAPAEWGDGTSLLLALDDLPGGSLSGLTIFFDTVNNSEELRGMLARSMWRVADGAGRFGPAGVYRPRVSRGGTMSLQSALSSSGQPTDDLQEPPADDIGGGAYAGLTFLFPEHIDGQNPAVCQRPMGLETAISRLFPPASIEILNRERVWIRISLVAPADAVAIPPLAGAFKQLLLHTMTFSNVECRDQSPSPNRHGSSLPIEFPGAGRYLVGLRAIHAGRSDTPIVPLLDASAPEGAMRYTVRSGRIEVIVPPSAAEEEVNVRVWTTHGDRANDMPSISLQSEIQLNDGGTLKLSAVKPPDGGRNQEDRSTAEARFASAILSRGRIVTQADLMAAVRAFDSRIVDVSAVPVAVRRERSLQTIERITVVLRSAEFPPSSEAEELRCLRQELEAGLRHRLPFDTDIEVAVQWDKTRPEETA